MIQQNASSIAGLLLTSEAVVTEKPEPKGGGAPAMPGGGGGRATCTEPVGRTAERIRWMNETGGGPQALRRFRVASAHPRVYTVRRSRFS
jgi:hypothetical protein